MTVASTPHLIRSVYVHAPFCARRCYYCDFAVTVRERGDLDEWRDAIAAELAQVREAGELRLADELETLYVGGGTPSLLGGPAMRALSRVFGDQRLRGADLEWTVEANPESFTHALARAWRDAGVNRLSLGIQTFHAPALAWMGRLHGELGAIEAVRAAKSVGLTNVSVDLIFGLPASLGRSWPEDLERVLDLDLPHVSLYGLTIEPRTPLGRAVAERRENPVDDGRYREEFLQASERLSAVGYEHYEVSSFARPGFASRHNRVYWDGRPYLGLGNGAHSYAHPIRRWNVRDWDGYRARALAGESVEEGRERLDDQARRLERLWLGLRTRDGLGEAELGDGAGVVIDRWRRAGLARSGTGTVSLTPAGWLELDRLAVELDSVLAAPARARA